MAISSSSRWRLLRCARNDMFGRAYPSEDKNLCDLYTGINVFYDGCDVSIRNSAAGLHM